MFIKAATANALVRDIRQQTERVVNVIYAAHQVDHSQLLGRMQGANGEDPVPLSVLVDELIDDLYGKAPHPGDSDANTVWVIFDYDTGDLATTTTYSKMDEALVDAEELNNAMVCPLTIA